MAAHGPVDELGAAVRQYSARCRRLAREAEEACDKKMRQRLEGYASQARAYADPEKRRRAVEALPAKLSSALGTAGSCKGALLGELLRWFKEEFFRWTDRPLCASCGTATKDSAGMVTANDEELRHGATRVEAWRCPSCNEVARFPRYNDPARLLETRHGRCGEWANCFTLISAALGYDCRLALDWTDHVWTEVRLDGRWVHCDPCEGCLDAPLMYEAGWGKKLSYIVAFSPTEVVDVTPRYTATWPQVLSRRKQVTEERLRELVVEVDEQVRAGVGAPTPPWRDAEVAELTARCSLASADGALSAAEMRGRTSGSAAWRQERGELGNFLRVAVVQEAPASLTIDAGFADGKTRPDVSETGSCTHARLLGGAAVTSLDGVPCVDLTVDGAVVEIAEDERTVALGDALISPAGFTIEAVVLVDAGKLNPAAHRNVLASRHGPASGWELRLCDNGGAIFLVTVDGHHHELASAAADERWGKRWCHIAGTFDGSVARLFIEGKLQAEAQIPPGTRSSFQGPTCFGRNPAWRDRGLRCWLHSARVSYAVVAPASFLRGPLR